MSKVTILFKDGEKREFKDGGRSGGSYRNSVSYEGSFVVIKTDYDEIHAFPSETVKEVIIDAPPGRW